MHIPANPHVKELIASHKFYLNQLASEASRTSADIVHRIETHAYVTYTSFSDDSCTLMIQLHDVKLGCHALEDVFSVRTNHKVTN